MRQSIPSPIAEARLDGDPREQLERVLGFSRRVLRHSWVIAIVLALGAIGCAVFFWLRTPLYRSETVILYTEGIRPTDATGDARGAPRNAAVRLREMLVSRQRLEKLIKEFRLYPKIIAQNGMVDAVEEFREDIEFRAPGSDTFAIGYRGTSPEQAKAVTERLVSSLLEEDSGIRRQQAKVTRDFLDGEKKKAVEELRDSETELAKFMAEHPGFANDIMLLQTGGGSATGAAIRASQTEMQRTAATTGAAPRYRFVSRPAAPKTAAQGSAPAPAAAAADASSGEKFRELEAERGRAEAALAAAQTDLAVKQGRFTEQHPDVRAAQLAAERARARLETVSTQVAAARPALVPVAPAAAAPAAQPTRTAGAARAVAIPAAAGAPAAARARADSDALVKLETEWAKLTRDVTEARQRHDAIELSFFKADMSAESEHGGQAVQMTVLDPAYLPLRAIPPGPVTWAAIFFALSLLIGTLMAMGTAAIDDRIYGGRDAEPLAPLLVEIPHRAIDKYRRSYA
jgi:uncharacterized protein involved in exopolysaccharide biosynthesis